MGLEPVISYIVFPKERALEILELAEKNGYVHQITNIDGENKIFDICNCNVKICNALRTSLLDVYKRQPPTPTVPLSAATRYAAPAR